MKAKTNNHNKLIEILSVLIKFNQNKGKNNGLLLQGELTFIRQLIPSADYINFSKIGIVEEGEYKGKICVEYSVEDLSDVGIYDIELKEDRLRMIDDLTESYSA